MRFPSLIRIILISTVAAALPAIPTKPFFPELYGGPVPEDRDITAIDTTPVDTTDYSSKHLQKRGHVHPQPKYLTSSHFNISRLLASP